MLVQCQYELFGDVRTDSSLASLGKPQHPEGCGKHENGVNSHQSTDVRGFFLRALNVHKALLNTLLIELLSTRLLNTYILVWL